MNINSIGSRFDRDKLLILHSADDGANSGNGEPAPSNETPEQRDERIAAAVDKKFNELLSKSGGNSDEALRTLVRSYNSLQNANTTLTTSNTQLKAQVPDETTKARYATFDSLGKPEDVAAALQERETLKAQIAERDRNDMLRTVAGEEYKFSVLKSLDSQTKDEKGNPPVYFEKDVTENGKTRRERFVTFHEGGKDEERTFEKFAEVKWPDFLPALRAKAPMGGGAGPTPPGAPPAPQTQPTGRIPQLF